MANQNTTDCEHCGLRFATHAKVPWGDITVEKLKVLGGDELYCHFYNRIYNFGKFLKNLPHIVNILPYSPILKTISYTECDIDEKNVSIIENFINHIPVNELNNFGDLITLHCKYHYSQSYINTNPNYLYTILSSLTTKITIVDGKLESGNSIIDKVIVNMVKSETNIQKIHHNLFPAFDPVTFYKLVYSLLSGRSDYLNDFEEHEMKNGQHINNLKEYIYCYHKQTLEIEHSKLYNKLYNVIHMSFTDVDERTSIMYETIYTLEKRNNKLENKIEKIAKLMKILIDNMRSLGAITLDESSNDSINDILQYLQS